ncbi:hypothetical protein [Vibrio tubiashii]|uniref:hypothetical protein n=1 Tax=Vibrio tubiashii TaxID=29498 RepID=UPI00349EB923
MSKAGALYCINLFLPKASTLESDGNKNKGLTQNANPSKFSLSRFLAFSLSRFLAFSLSRFLAFSLSRFLAFSLLL